MTRNQTRAIQHIQSQHEAQRFTASQASRAATVAALKAAALERAGELAQLARFAESKRVLELSFFAEED